MDFFTLINKRESVRGYLDKQVEREKIIKIIEAARVAPSACNAQPWKFIVVNEKEITREVAKNLYEPMIGLNKFALTAPVFIVVVGEKRNLTSKMGELIKKKDYTSIDIGIVSEHICLAATELGLGTCMMGWFKEKEIKRLLNINKNKEIHLVISLGYYDGKEPRNKVRKPIDEILSFNEYK
ncbi:nitroreductase family protein [Clostridium baratii]|uniref:Nitroreductase family protein n=1 Tax=Clostridium baratii str. Sullivan TaxID=1415775 RepID=A0A0A7FTI0_9CLOT|nr:nitroreductase family protein [Clostridium baratii]AIY82912.1 nitroreductase family protein [Clostridium baratii str. Sullivan]MDU4911630.1 nitroreductase family protein [Clostridium baratii]CUP61325.1 nitroreductase [Clostridium baratii]